MSCEYANTIHPIAMLFGGFLAPLVEPPLLSWDPPAIVPIPSKLGVPLISVLFCPFSELHVPLAGHENLHHLMSLITSSQTLPFHGFHE